MNILIANDDGISTQSIRILVKNMAEIGDVYVVAPKEQNSGASHRITMTDILYLEPYNMEYAKEAYSLSGSPVDCIKMGIEFFKDRGIDIDLVISGINYGGNLGEDVLYSGTVGAGREGLLCGKLAIAVSLDNSQGGDFEYCARFVKDICRNFQPKDFKNPEYMLNINIPDIDPKDIKGVKVLGLGSRKYPNWFMKKDREDGTFELRYGGEIEKQYVSEKDIIDDVKAVDNGYINITPLKADLTSGENLERLEKIYGKEIV